MYLVRYELPKSRIFPLQFERNSVGGLVPYGTILDHFRPLNELPPSDDGVTGFVQRRQKKAVSAGRGECYYVDSLVNKKKVLQYIWKARA